MKILNAYYDLRAAPLTFDFAWYLAVAACHARLSDSSLSVTLFYPQFRQAGFVEKGYSAGYRHWRLNNIAVRMCHLCPDVVEVISNRSKVLNFVKPVFPESYDPQNVDMSGFTRIPCTHNDLEAVIDGVADHVFFRSTDFADRWFRNRFGDERVVVLNIRRTEHGFNQRNTPLEVWRAVYRVLTASGYRVVTMPDQDEILGGPRVVMDDWEEVPEASMDLDIRLALFRNAFGVVGWSGGNSALLPLCGARFITFGQWNEASPMTNRKFLSRKGPRLGSQPTWFDTSHQRYDWCAGQDVTADYVLAVVRPWLAGLEPRALPL